MTMRYLRQCSACAHEYDWTMTHQCPRCATVRKGPKIGSPNAGRRKSAVPSSTRNAGVIWVRLNKAQAKTVRKMLEGTSLDKAKLGRLGLALIDKLRGRRKVDVYLRDALGDDDYKACIK